MLAWGLTWDHTACQPPTYVLIHKCCGCSPERLRVLQRQHQVHVLIGAIGTTPPSAVAVAAAAEVEAAAKFPSGERRRVLFFFFSRGMRLGGGIERVMRKRWLRL